jgi:hypothetical protein
MVLYPFFVSSIFVRTIVAYAEFADVSEKIFQPFTATEECANYGLHVCSILKTKNRSRFNVEMINDMLLLELRHRADLLLRRGMHQSLRFRMPVLVMPLPLTASRALTWISKRNKDLNWGMSQIPAQYKKWLFFVTTDTSRSLKTASSNIGQYHFIVNLGHRPVSADNPLMFSYVLEYSAHA